MTPINDFMDNISKKYISKFKVIENKVIKSRFKRPYLLMRKYVSNIFHFYIFYISLENKKFLSYMTLKKLKFCYRDSKQFNNPN